MASKNLHSTEFVRMMIPAELTKTSFITRSGLIPYASVWDFSIASF